MIFKVMVVTEVRIIIHCHTRIMANKLTVHDILSYDLVVANWIIFGIHSRKRVSKVRF